MPSNPEQLLGAILVRKDIFHRFETTMHDTCLDANNLLEYLFSLYNSTAVPTERENLPSPQSLAFMRRDTDYKKGLDRGPQVFPNPPPSGNQQLLQPNIQNRSSDPRIQIPGAVDGQRKKIKVEQPIFQTGLNSTAHQHQNYSQPAVLKSFDNRSVFPAASNHQISNIKMEVTAGVEPHHVQPSSCLPPFSQICRQGNRPYSPVSAQYSNSHPIPAHKEEHQKLGHDPVVNDVKTEMDVVLPVVSVNQETQEMQNSSKNIKKQRLKGYSTDGSNNVERISRKKKHQCFCGALFTRADNLKRHIRKCHEEKLDKLKGPSLDAEANTSGGTVTESFSLVYPSTSQNCIESSQGQNSESPRQHTSQQYTSQPHTSQPHTSQPHTSQPHTSQPHTSQQHTSQPHTSQQHTSQPHTSQPHTSQPHTSQPHTSQQHASQSHTSQQYLQQEDSHNLLIGSAVKVTPSVKWSCFCGESFDNHRLLVEHTRTHESNS